MSFRELPDQYRTREQSEQAPFGWRTSSRESRAALARCKSCRDMLEFAAVIQDGDGERLLGW